MIINDIKEGNQVWFQMRDINENGRIERCACSGTVTGIADKKVSVQIDGREDVKSLQPFQCYRTQEALESDMKWDRCMDVFSDKLYSAAEKYMDKCTDFLKGYLKGCSKSMIPSGQELLVSEAGSRLKLAGIRFKESVSSFADRFTGQAQDYAMSRMDRNTHHDMLHTDLSQYEPGYFQSHTQEGFAKAVENIGKTDGMSL